MTGSAIDTAAGLFSTSGVRVIIVITDGYSDDSAPEAMQRAVSKGVEVMTIGVGGFNYR
jgi:hypothetical protein